MWKYDRSLTGMCPVSHVYQTARGDECAPVKCADDPKLAVRLLNDIKGKTTIDSLEDWANSILKIQHGQMQRAAPGRGINPCTNTDWRLASQGTALWKRPQGLGRQQTRHDTAMCLSSKGQQHPGLYKEEHSSTPRKVIITFYSVFLSPYLEHHAQYWASPCERHIDKLEQVQQRAISRVGGWEHVPCEAFCSSIQWEDN